MSVLRRGFDYLNLASFKVFFYHLYPLNVNFKEREEIAKLQEEKLNFEKKMKADEDRRYLERIEEEKKILQVKKEERRRFEKTWEEKRRRQVEEKEKQKQEEKR